MLKVQMTKPCAKRRGELCVHYPTATWRQAGGGAPVVRAGWSSTGAHARSAWLLYGRGGRKAWSGDAPNKAVKKPVMSYHNFQ